jgi:phenylacetate-CoA ligase
MIWNEAAECMEPSKLEQLQGERLRATAKHAYEHVPAYRVKMDDAGVKPDDINGLEDLARIPFTVKSDFRDNYPFGLFAVPDEQIVRIHASSGTTGKPTVVAYTRGDIELWAEVMARTLAAGGTESKDRLQNSYGYGLFTGGLGAHYGAEKIGATVIPTSGGNTARQLQVMQDFGSTVICCTPSYALYLAEAGTEAGIDFERLPLRVGLLGAEPWTESMRDEIEQKMHIVALDIYGLTEMIGPGVSYECLEKCGAHINEDHFLAEIIDPETLEPLPAGSPGELVFTTLTREAAPVLRFRTRDICVLLDEPCKCGRTTRRMARVTGRSDDMLIIRGVNVFPSQIEEVLMGIEGVSPHYQIVIDREKGKLDELEVWMEVSPEVFSDEIRQLETLEKKIATAIGSALGLSVRAKLVEPKTIARSEGKAKRVIDRRDLGR